MSAVIPKYTRRIALCLLIITGYYLLPEYYLQIFHPHRHDSKLCLQHDGCQVDILAGEPQHCPQKEDNKQLYDNGYRFFFLDPLATSFHYKGQVTRKLTKPLFATTFPRAPPSCQLNHQSLTQIVNLHLEN